MMGLERDVTGEMRTVDTWAYGAVLGSHPSVRSNIPETSSPSADLYSCLAHRG